MKRTTVGGNRDHLCDSRISRSLGTPTRCVSDRNEKANSGAKLEHFPVTSLCSRSTVSLISA